MGVFKDLTGQRFGRLVAVRRDGRTANYETIWLCQCDCGRASRAIRGNLMNGITRSCGCFLAQRRAEAHKLDLTGYRSGMLVAQRCTGTKNKAGCYLWECGCDCGGLKLVPAFELNKGWVISCGCQKGIQAGIRPAHVRGKHAAKQSVRRAREMQAEGSYTAEEIDGLFKAQRGVCALCPAPLADFHRDHIVPLVKGGSNWIANIQLLCQPCNSQKQALDQDEFLRRRAAA